MPIRIFLAILISLVCLSQTVSQSLILEQNNGSIIPHSLNSIKKLSFINGEIKVESWSGDEEGFLLPDLSKMFFQNVITGIDVNLGVDHDFFKIFPNPVADLLHIKWPQWKSSENLTITIFSMAGDLLISQKANISSGYVCLNVDMLGQGVYMVQMGNSDIFQSLKFIKL